MAFNADPTNDNIGHVFPPLKFFHSCVSYSSISYSMCLTYDVSYKKWNQLRQERIMLSIRFNFSSLFSTHFLAFLLQEFVSESLQSSPST